MLILANDHGGYNLKVRISSYLEGLQMSFLDLGCGADEKAEYPEIAAKAAGFITRGEAERGILFCGTGIGISIAANKVRSIRCALAGDPFSARMSVEHNNANMLALGGRVIGEELAVEIVKAWLFAEFEGGRHAKRVEMIEKLLPILP